MVRVIVHAGFHKTGTSSLQDYLRRHRAALAPWLCYYGKADFLDAGNLARVYGLKPYPWRLRRVRRALREFLASIPEDPVIVLSWEGFSGVMPGHRRWSGQIRGYGRAAIPLARAIRSEILRRFGPGTKVEFVYTIRQSRPWARSVWGHLVRSIRMTQDATAFVNDIAPLIDLRSEAARIARAVSGAPVHVAQLEDLGACPEGPAGIILDLAGVPRRVRSDLGPAPRRNAGLGADWETRFLNMNRQTRNKPRLKAEKDALLAQEGR